MRSNEGSYSHFCELNGTGSKLDDRREWEENDREKLFKMSFLMYWDRWRSISFHHHVDEEVRKIEQTSDKKDKVECRDENAVNGTVKNRSKRSLIEARNLKSEIVLNLRRAGRYKIQYVVHKSTMKKEITEMETECIEGMGIGEERRKTGNEAGSDDGKRNGR